MSLLFSPYQIKNLHLKNRIAVPPMCQYSAVNGLANNWHLVHLGAMAVGGAGLIIQEATAISPEGRISVACLGIWEDAQINKLKEIVDFVHQNGAYIGIQLAHAGRKGGFDIPWENVGQVDDANGGWIPVAPSAIKFNQKDKLPVALDLAGIDKVKADFKAAAKRAHAAGYDMIEIHAAHGYLMHQFLSPLSNTRTDNYGGSFDNRVRLLLEVIAEVKEVWSAHKAIFVRISATDWVEGGWDLPSSVALCKLLKTKGVDLIDVSTGGLALAQEIPLAPNYQVPFAESIKKEANIAVGAVGLITDAAQAEAILAYGKADLILVGREYLRNPRFAQTAAKALNEDIQWPNQYLRAK